MTSGCRTPWSPLLRRPDNELKSDRLSTARANCFTGKRLRSPTHSADTDRGEGRHHTARRCAGAGCDCRRSYAERRGVGRWVDDVVVTVGRDQILLGGYAAKQCPVRVQNDYSPLVPTRRWAPSPEDQARLDAGIVFEGSVFGELIALHPTAVAVEQLRKADAIGATVHAMGSGAPLVLGGWLPDDDAGGRTGRPDLLVKVKGGYLPADVKHHSTVKPGNTTRAVMSAVASPENGARCQGGRRRRRTVTRTEFNWPTTHACCRHAATTPDRKCFGVRCWAPARSW